MDNTVCPLCRTEKVREYSQDKRRNYYQCQVCSLVFVPAWQFLSATDEKKRYDLHQNSPQDLNYRRFLSRLFMPLQKKLNPGSHGLDFGSGPEPTLSRMFEEAGHSMTLFDHFYEPVPAVLEQQYDFITATEVVEHLHDPKKELERLWTCLRQGGWLGIMTNPAVEQDAFPQWYYKNDLTHVCFFSRATFVWLALQWHADVAFADGNVVLFHKKPVSSASPQVGAGRCEKRIPMKTLPVLYQDEHLVAVNKSVGLLVHRSSIDRHENENAMKIVRDQLGQWVYPIHRLDKSTSGVLVFALDRETARRMTRSFTDETISKGYLALVRGVTKEAERIDHPLKDILDKMTDQRTDKDKPAKPSVTDYRRLASIELPHPVGRYSTARYSLITVFPLTGRNHQIRRHMKHIFHPIVGDTTYGDGKQNDFFRRQFNCHRLLLHAYKIEFIHPYTGQLLHIRAPLDDTFAALLEELQWHQFDLP